MQSSLSGSRQKAHLILRSGRRPRLEGWATDTVLVPTLLGRAMRGSSG